MAPPGTNTELLSMEIETACSVGMWPATAQRGVGAWVRPSNFEYCAQYRQLHIEVEQRGYAHMAGVLATLNCTVCV